MPGRGSAKGSFAGQFESFLSVAREDVFSKIVAVIKASTSSHVEDYKKLIHLGAGPDEMAVLVQAMIDPRAAGVMFSADPIDASLAGQNTVVINAVSGLADRLMRGQEDGEHITVCNCRVRRRGTVSALDPATILDLAKMAKQLENLCAFTVDVEWAISKGTIYILQVRPVTTTEPIVSAKNDLGNTNPVNADGKIEASDCSGIVGGAGTFAQTAAI